MPLKVRGKLLKVNDEKRPEFVSIHLGLVACVFALLLYTAVTIFSTWLLMVECVRLCKQLPHVGSGKRRNNSLL